METINNMAAAASKAVWGDDKSHKEPISGATGDVSKGEPFDAGNLDAEEQKKVEKRLSTEDNSTDSRTSKPSAVGAGPSRCDDTTMQKPESSTAMEPEPLDPSELKGQGPKPIEVLAMEQGGDAGKANISTHASTAEAPSDPNSKGNDVIEHGSSKHETSNTGQHVKTTGFAADGGNFDATLPGAGVEADRLKHQKNISEQSHHDPTTKPLDAQAPASASNHSNNQTDGKKSHPSPPTKSSEHQRKPSITERIRAKFHRHEKVNKGNKADD